MGSGKVITHLPVFLVLTEVVVHATARLHILVIQKLIVVTQTVLGQGKIALITPHRVLVKVLTGVVGLVVFQDQLVALGHPHVLQVVLVLRIHALARHVLMGAEVHVMVQKFALLHQQTLQFHPPQVAMRVYVRIGLVGEVVVAVIMMVATEENIIEPVLQALHAVQHNVATNVPLLHQLAQILPPPLPPTSPLPPFPFQLILAVCVMFLEDQWN